MNIIETNLKFQNSLSKRYSTKQILLHHAEASHCTIYDIHQWHLSRGWAGCAYHFFVTKDGKVYRGRPEWAVGSHCKGHNTYTLGVCAEGDYMKETMPTAQKIAIIELCIYLCAKYGITDVRGHKEVPYSTDCPGTKYPLQEIKASIKNKKVIQPNVFTNLSYKKPMMKSNDIKVVQIMLHKLGYLKTEPDGIFGENTQNAVLAYQKEHKALNQRGVVDKETWNSIMVHK